MDDKQRTDTDCPVCGSFRFPHDQYCRDCTEYKKTVEDLAKTRKRAEAFGRVLW